MLALVSRNATITLQGVQSAEQAEPCLQYLGQGRQSARDKLTLPRWDKLNVCELGLNYLAR
jgi:hypothetical protein